MNQSHSVEPLEVDDESNHGVFHLSSQVVKEIQEEQLLDRVEAAGETIM